MTDQISFLYASEISDQALKSHIWQERTGNAGTNESKVIWKLQLVQISELITHIMNVSDKD